MLLTGGNVFGINSLIRSTYLGFKIIKYSGAEYHKSRLRDQFYSDRLRSRMP